MPRCESRGAAADRARRRAARRCRLRSPGWPLVLSALPPALAAAATRWALDRGAAHVALFTDLANPTTNRLYPRLGYRPVHNALDVRLGPPPA